MDTENEGQVALKSLLELTEARAKEAEHMLAVTEERNAELRRELNRVRASRDRLVEAYNAANAELMQLSEQMLGRIEQEGRSW